LWQMLVLITARKAIDLCQYEQRRKRGGGRVRGESALRGPHDPDSAAGLDQLVGPEPAAEFAVQLAEGCRPRLDQLEDAGLRSVARWKMEGYTTEEIAARLGCVPRTVERKLWRIRSIWEQAEDE